MWRDPSEEVVQDFGPSTCFCFLTVVAPMLTRENEGSKKSVRKVVQDFVHEVCQHRTWLAGWPKCVCNDAQNDSSCERVMSHEKIRR